MASPIVIRTPACPLCGAFPHVVLGNVSQAFCPGDDCPVMTWNPQLGPEQLADAHFIDLPDLG